jgi:hypothetical protein
MTFLKQELTTLDVVNGVFPWLPPTEEEILRSDALAFSAGPSTSSGEPLDKAKVLHEFFMLKSGVALEYGLGLLETLGMRAEGLQQFHDYYIQRLAEGVADSFPKSREAAVGMLASRIKAYTKALHGEHPEDPHLAVADVFTRFCGAPDDPGLVSFCLDTCKGLNRRFLKELSDFGLAVEDK